VVADESSEGSRERAALARFEAIHREDPRSLLVNGETVPWSVEYHARLSQWVRRFEPQASLALRLAAACQHIRRWRLARRDYEAGRRGYRQWRSDLAQLHAATAREVLAEVGFDDETIARVETLVRKIGLARDPEVQLFEDAICMVFFELDYADLARRLDDAKLIDVLRRTWTKMSPRGREAALALSAGMDDRERRLLEAATAA
jgi:hypothetical protein